MYVSHFLRWLIQGWETRIQARAGNYGLRTCSSSLTSGSRIDYILASDQLKDQFIAADIDAKTIGSDHCPVWLRMSIPAQVQAPTKKPPRLCARYLSHVAPTQSIRSLFANVPPHVPLRMKNPPTTESAIKAKPEENSLKREAAELKAPSKRARTAKPSKPASAQRTMSDFLKGNSQTIPEQMASDIGASVESSRADYIESVVDESQYLAELVALESERDAVKSNASKQWTSIFTPKNAPLCDAHGLPCIELVTKKPGPNLGRKFWICSKPVGPGYDNGKRADHPLLSVSNHYRPEMGN